MNVVVAVVTGRVPWLGAVFGVLAVCAGIAYIWMEIQMRRRK